MVSNIFFVIPHLEGVMGPSKVYPGRFEGFLRNVAWNTGQNQNLTIALGSWGVRSQKFVFWIPHKKYFQSVKGYFLIIFLLEKVIQGSLIFQGNPKGPFWGGSKVPKNLRITHISNWVTLWRTYVLMKHVCFWMRNVFHQYMYSSKCHPVREMGDSRVLGHFGATPKRPFRIALENQRSLNTFF